MRDKTGGRPDGRTGGRWDSMLSAIRRMAGMPDYQAHCEHLRRRHPGAPLPSEREFFEKFVLTRYGDGPTRCC